MRVLWISSIALLLCDVVFGAAHTHIHNKERPQDGAHSPRDQHHFQHGEHNAAFDHEAIIGSAKEAEEYDNLSPEEAQRRLELLLQKMDRNRDRVIERHELKTWILRSFKMLSEEESQERLEEADENADGYVTWAEYIAETYNIKNEEDQQLLDADEQEEEQKMMKEDRQLFNAADKNVDGKLDEAEFLLFTHPEEHQEMLPIILEQTLADKDENGDGVIDFQEYVGSRGDPHPEFDADEVKEQKISFAKKDRDGSGVLQGDELHALAEMSKDIADDEVLHLFGSADDDGDDRLSFDEILSHHDVFVGSEATDYGDHLHNLDRFDDEL